LDNRDRRDVRGGRAAERESERGDRDEAAKPRGRGDSVISTTFPPAALMASSFLISG
jgi:hypothetical protein